MNTAAFKKAIAAVKAAGGGQLVVPKGVFVTGPFRLCSSLNLHLDEGAVIQQPDTFEAEGMPDPSTFKTQAEADAAYRPKVPKPLISGGLSRRRHHRHRQDRRQRQALVGVVRGCGCGPARPH